MKPTKHKWTFAARFRRHAFGWKSQPPIKRIKEAVREIKKVARKEPVIAAEGAVIFFEKLSPAIEHVDSSSGAIGGTVNDAIVNLVPVIVDAPAEVPLRQKWLDRLWKAVRDDGIPYIEMLPDFWGELCVTPGLASRWADEFLDPLKLSWSSSHADWFDGTNACVSSLFKAERYDDLLCLLAMAPHDSWDLRIWGVKALVKQGKKSEAIEFAESTQDNRIYQESIEQVCEEILLSDDVSVP